MPGGRQGSLLREDAGSNLAILKAAEIRLADILAGATQPETADAASIGSLALAEAAAQLAKLRQSVRI